MPKKRSLFWRMFKPLLKNVRPIILIGLVFGVVSFFGMHHLIPPAYTSTATVYINNSLKSSVDSQKVISQLDLMVSEILIPTYERMLRSNIALEDILKRSGLSGYTTHGINSAIKTISTPGTAILKINVTDKNPENAAKIANATIGTLRDVVSSQVEGSSIMVIDYAAIPDISSSLSREINALIGVVIGCFLSSIYFILRGFKKVVIASKDDLNKILGIPLLGTIPYINDENIVFKK